MGQGHGGPGAGIGEGKKEEAHVVFRWKNQPDHA